MSMPLKIEEVIAAYEKIGMKPCAWHYLSGEYCCVLSALAMARGCPKELIDELEGQAREVVCEFFSRWLNMGAREVDGFIHGLDFAGVESVMGQRFDEGYNAGFAIAGKLVQHYEEVKYRIVL